MPVDVSAAAAPWCEGLLARAAQVLLCETGHERDELSIAVVDDAEICDLNGRFRGVERPTDVLAFPQGEGEPLADGEGATHLGDVVISAETSKRQATDGGWTHEAELVRLLVHGFLHLLGYDHEVSESEAKRMRAEEARLSSLLERAGIDCAGGLSG